MRPSFRSSASLAERFARSKSEEDRTKFFMRLNAAEIAALQYDWKFWGRPSQQTPSGEWSVWLCLSGRGWGKTRTGAEFIRSEVESGRARRIALIAETAADARDVLVEGESGILRISPPDNRPIYEPSKRRVTWPNGAVATLFNAVEPDQLRGPQFDTAWCDELAKWRYAQETWEQLQFGLRLGMHPRCIITTTPRPKPIIRALVEEARKGTVYVTRGRMDDNRSNLAPAFVETIRAKYGGTRLGRQELDAEILEDVVGAYWTRGMFERDGFRVNVLPMMRRVVVAVDPSGAGDRDNDLADEIGIVVAGLGFDKRFYVLADLSLRAGPNAWARTAADAYEDYKADRLIAERNFGGAMVEETIRRVAPNVSYKEVTASRSKQVRSEPIAALYEQGRVSHYRDPNGGDLSLLEDQLVCMTDDGYTGPGSPDRVDALVWALTELSDRTLIQVAKAAVSNALNPAAWGRMPVIDLTRARR